MDRIIRATAVNGFIKMAVIIAKDMVQRASRLMNQNMSTCCLARVHA